MTDSVLSPPRTRAAAISWALLPPLAAWLVARAVLLLTAKASGFAPFSPGLWMRWDSHLYVLLSRLGYTLVPCEEGTGYAPDEWCGTSGWFPLLPVLLRLSSRLQPAFAGAAWVALFAIGTLVVIWNGFLSREPRNRAVLLLLLAAFFPGNVYLHAVFPMAPFTFFAAASLVLALRDRPVLAALCAFLAATTHSTAVVLAGALFVHGLWSLREGMHWQRAWRALLPAAGVVLGYGAVLLAMRLATGHWDAFFRIQAKYGHHPTFPLATLAEVIRNAARGSPREYLVSGWQSLVTALLVVACLSGAWRTRRGAPRESVLLAAYVLVFWLFPLTMGPRVGFWRSDLLLMPAVVALRPMPAWLLAIVLAVLAALTPFLGADFFHSVIV